MSFLQLSHNFAMSCLWCLWEVYEVYEKSMRLTDKSVQKRPRRNILTCHDVARWSRSPTDLSMRSMSLIDKSVPVEYRYAFSTALLQLCYSNYFYQPMILRQIIITSRVNFMMRARCIIIILIQKLKNNNKHGRWYFCRWRTHNSPVYGMNWFCGIGQQWTGEDWELSWQLTNRMSIMTNNWFHWKVLAPIHPIHPQILIV